MRSTPGKYPLAVSPCCIGLYNGDRHENSGFAAEANDNRVSGPDILEREIKRIKNGRMYLIPRGHGTTGTAKFWKQEVEELLQTAPRRAI